MLKPHRGILTHKIPAEGFGGLIFALGTVMIFVIGVPEIRQFSLFAIPAGGILAGVLYLWHNQTRW